MVLQSHQRNLGFIIGYHKTVHKRISLKEILKLVLEKILEYRMAHLNVTVFVEQLRESLAESVGNIKLVMPHIRFYPRRVRLFKCFIYYLYAMIYVIGIL